MNPCPMLPLPLPSPPSASGVIVAARTPPCKHVADIAAAPTTPIVQDRARRESTVKKYAALPEAHLCTRPHPATVLSTLRGIACPTTTLFHPNQHRTPGIAAHDAITPKLLNHLDLPVRDVYRLATSHIARKNRVAIHTNTDRSDTRLPKLTVLGTVESTANPANIGSATNTANVTSQDSRLTARRTAPKSWLLTTTPLAAMVALRSLHRVRTDTDRGQSHPPMAVTHQLSLGAFPNLSSRCPEP